MAPAPQLPTFPIYNQAAMQQWNKSAQTPISTQPVKMNDQATEFTPGKTWAPSATKPDLSMASLYARFQASDFMQQKPVQQQPVQQKPVQQQPVIPPGERPPNYDPIMINSADYKPVFI